MYRTGHTGLALLAYAPIGYVLAVVGHPAVAIVSGIGVLVVEPVPDWDFRIPFLTHRGVSHSLLAIIVVAGGLGSVGWYVGRQLTHAVAKSMRGIAFASHVIRQVLPSHGILGSVTRLVLETSLQVLAGFVIHPVAGAFQSVAVSYTPTGFAVIGGFVGGYGVGVHLLGDVITIRGIAPFLPVSDWNISLSRLRAKNSVANSVFLAVGVVAIAVVISLSAPAVVSGGGIHTIEHTVNAESTVPNLGAGPLVPTPVGVADAANQTTTDTSPTPTNANGSVEINRTLSNRTRIVLDNVTLARNGFIVAQVNSSANSSAPQVLGHTQYVRNGTFHDVILPLNKSINGSQTLSVVLYNDTHDNQMLDTPGNGTTDAPYRTPSGAPVHDTVQLGAPTNHTRASVALDGTNNTTARRIVVSKARLPNGGYVAIHGGAYDEGGIVYGSEITVSKYLSPGIHRNITIPVKRGVPGSQNVSRLNATGENLSAVVYRDTNQNHHYDFQTSYGNHDGYYQTQDGDPVADTKQVVFEKNVKIANQRSQPASASIQFTGQQLHRANGSPTVTIDRVTLQHGGFVAIHDARDLPPTRNPLDSVLGHSRYLKPGTHRNVSVRLPKTALTNHTQTLVAVPYLDTNHNRHYDYVQSGGETDYAYIAQRNSSTVIVNQTATVQIPQSQVATTTQTAASTSTSTPPTTNDPSRSTGGIKSEQGSGFISANPIFLILGGLIIVAGLGLIRREWRR